METEYPFHLSIVATSRNDDHGKNLLYRMQLFVNGLIAQCIKHQVSTELILVEWNPPEQDLPLCQVLHFPSEKSPCTIRIISVPNTIHRQLEHSDKINLFQMIAKNVGIRRAKGKFVLATNIDILFSDEIFLFIKNKLTSGYFYRVDRLDVPALLSQSNTFDEVLYFCSKNFFRINNALETKIAGLNKINVNFKMALKKILYFCFPNHSRLIHCNACGDFTLLSLKDWEKLRGYPEWNIFSWNVDSVLLHQAHQHGIKQRNLSVKCPIYHIEHESGSGFTPEYAQKLFDRLHEKGISFLDVNDLKKLVSQLRASKQPVYYNEDWGMPQFSFKETVF